ncbi:MAG TPA: hypothetical protein VML75_02500 [Kofleriaceae bacterium]|nr:hypothetical protein [Kofleriaceae bacterium]
MSKPNTPASSQTQQSTTDAGFDPMQAWTRLTQENIARVQGLYDELASWEAKAYDRAKQTADQLSELANESLAYATKLASEWRALTLQATRKAAELARAGGPA